MSFYSRCIPSSPSRLFKIQASIATHFLALLNIVFLVLPGVSGPHVGFFWLRVEYNGQSQSQSQSIQTAKGVNVNGTVEEDGENWYLGGFGVCKLGEKCQPGLSPPDYYTPIQQVLQLHLAITAIFFVNWILSYVLFSFPQSISSKRYSTLIPLFAPFFTCIIFIADLCVAHALEIKEGVKEVEKIDVFWLGTVAFVFSILWCIFAELDGMYKRHDFAEFNKPIVEPEPERGLAEKAVHGVYSLWPWRREEKSRENGRKREDKHNHRSRSGSKGAKRKSHHRSQSMNKRSETA
ncbi:hypothetical protein I203_103596 [Kwoniella mangroviensis CBS 8507]|uniref:uncharacterized protein n=1 Tax=Kwoniella mangroviensis CBS 8507 TaxID=1296122 RepID=UPI003063695A